MQKIRSPARKNEFYWLHCCVDGNVEQLSPAWYGHKKLVVSERNKIHLRYLSICEWIPFASHVQQKFQLQNRKMLLFFSHWLLLTDINQPFQVLKQCPVCLGGLYDNGVNAFIPKSFIYLLPSIINFPFLPVKKLISKMKNLGCVRKVVTFDNIKF